MYKVVRLVTQELVESPIVPDDYEFMTVKQESSGYVWYFRVETIPRKRGRPPKPKASCTWCGQQATVGSFCSVRCKRLSTDLKVLKTTGSPTLPRSYRRYTTDDLTERTDPQDWARRVQQQSKIADRPDAAKFSTDHGIDELDLTGKRIAIGQSPSPPSSQ